jgi:hypothetical protein
MNRQKKIFTITAISAVALLAIIYALVHASAWREKVTEQPASPEVVQFAQCLASKGATMYGAAWCPHCQREKARFGDAFKYVPYVECPQNMQLCLDKGVQGYPTWIFSDGTRLEGEQELVDISKASGCPLVQPQ